MQLKMMQGSFLFNNKLFILLRTQSKVEHPRNYSILVVTSKDSNNKTIDHTIYST